MAHAAFIWHDLLTDDVDADLGFFRSVIGWSVEDESHYKIFRAGDDKVAGLMALPPRAVEAGAPPHWLGHVEVSDLATSSAQVEALGGQILVAPQTIEGVCSFCVIADPLGASLSLFEPITPMAPTNAVASNELNTTDYERVWPFYAELFGWEAVADIDIGDGLTCRLFRPAGAAAPIGAMSNTAASMTFPPTWLYYFAVDDLDAALDRVRDARGAVLNGPETIPRGDRLAQCQSPSGAFFALRERAASRP